MTGERGDVDPDAEQETSAGEGAHTLGGEPRGDGERWSSGGGKADDPLLREALPFEDDPTSDTARQGAGREIEVVPGIRNGEAAICRKEQARRTVSAHVAVIVSVAVVVAVLGVQLGVRRSGMPVHEGETRTIALTPDGKDGQACPVERRITGPLSLKDKNGTTQVIPVEAQRNAGIAIETIEAANWFGVTEQDRYRLMVMALIAMAQESFFGTSSSSREPDANDDTGPYQLRARVGWHANGNTVAENNRTLQDVVYGTRVFIQGHRVAVAHPQAAGPVGYVIPGIFQQENWRIEEPWEVVANVQVPARNYRVLYDKWVPVAEDLIAFLSGEVTHARAWFLDLREEQESSFGGSSFLRRERITARAVGEICRTRMRDCRPLPEACSLFPER